MKLRKRKMLIKNKVRKVHVINLRKKNASGRKMLFFTLQGNDEKLLNTIIYKLIN